VSRAVSSVLGVLLLTALTLVLAGAVGAFAVDLNPGASEVTPHQLIANVNATYGRISLIHQSGPTLDVRKIDLRIIVDGTPLPHQPPVPYYSADGFHRFPKGPFNPMADPQWEIGEEAMVIATHGNRAAITPDSQVRVELYRDGLRIAVTETRAR